MIMEATIREVVRQEVSAALRERPGSPGSATRASWMTPPAAARQVGISEKAVRMMIKRGTLTTRLRNVEVDPRQPKYLVNVDEVAAAAQRAPPAPGKAIAGPPDLVEQAVRIRAKRAGR
jgi:hypothetical protein